MDIHDYKKRLEKVEKGIRNSSLSEKNKKIIFDYEKQMFIKEFSVARIERCVYIIGVISERLYKDIDVLEKEDIEAFLEWIQRKDITDWTKYTYKQVFKTFLKRIGKNRIFPDVMLQTPVIYKAANTKIGKQPVFNFLARIQLESGYFHHILSITI